MSNPHLIGPVAGTTTARTAWRGSRRALPDDLLRDASRRLGVLSLVAASLWVVGTVFGHLAARSMSHGDPQWLRLGIPDAIALASTLASVGLFVYTRTGHHDPRRTLDLGLAYMVLTSFALGLMFHWEPMPMDARIAPVISWVGAVVLMFAGLVPSTPGKTLMAGLVAASMNPLSMLIARARGIWPFPSASDALLMHYPDYLLVGVAVVTAHIVTTLGRQVATARDMGSYRLGELLGRGGMGEVYLATHRMLARPAAIKLIRPEVLGSADPADARRAIARFTREAEAAANLRSPHTVELYDFGVTSDQTLYIVMEFLDGLDLDTLVRQHGRVPAGRVVHILRQVCASLEEAHAAGLVHRDIKPANIHIGRLGLTCDFVKVLDFGLVKPVADASGDHDHPTRDGVLMGTPAYMAPEMALGGDVDARTDLYAVGCVAYYLLTGQQVFEGQTVVHVIAQHLHAAPVAPSARMPTPPPPQLEQLVLACLAKAPADRPQSALALSRALQAIDGGAWTDDDAQAWWAAHGAVGADTPGRLGSVTHRQASGDTETRLHTALEAPHAPPGP